MNQNVSELYFNYLREEGYIPHIDDDGDIIFKYEGRTFILHIDKEDAQFFRLTMPNFWSIDDEAERERAFRIANEVNGSLKVGKVVIIKDNTWATSEMFIDDAPLLEDFFQRTLDVTRAAADRFAKRMRDED